VKISLETVIAASPMLGHKLEDRSRVSEQQDPRLVENFQQSSMISLEAVSKPRLT
jgi:hypothetical protein